MSSQSDISPFSGISGSCSQRIRSVAGESCCASISVPSFPALSLSGIQHTEAPLNQVRYSGLHFPAPPGQVVAANPSLARLSQSFSPSTNNTVLPSSIAFSIPGSRYGTRSTPSRVYFPSGLCGRKSLGSNLTTLKT